MSENYKCVAVTHFINPHLFWYHDNHVPNEAYAEIVELEKQLEKIENQKEGDPAIGALVAVRYLPWGKLIRARVDYIDVRAGEVIMWAIDHGFPFQSRGDHIFRLPQKFNKSIQHVQLGGLVDTFPADNSSSFQLDRVHTKKTEKWSQKACDLMEKLLKEAAEIEITEQFSTNNQSWVKLLLTPHIGEKFNIHDYLVKKNFAKLKIEQNFRKICRELDTTKISRWLTNEGNNKCKRNSTINSPDCKKNNQNCAKEQMSSNSIVEEWFARNEQLRQELQESGRSHEPPFGNSPMQLNTKRYNQVTNNERSNQKEFSGACKKSLPMFHGRASGQEPFLQPSRIQSDNLKKRDAGMIAERREINYNRTQRGNNTRAAHSRPCKKPSNTSAIEPNAESKVPLFSSSCKKPIKLPPAGNDSSNLKKDANEVKHWHWKATTVCHHEPHEKETIIFDPPNKALKEEDDSLDFGNLSLNSSKLDSDIVKFAAGENFVNDYYKSLVRDSNEDNESNVLIRIEEPPFEIVETDYKYEKSTAADHSPMQLNPKEYNQVTNNEGSNQKWFSGACKKSLPMFHGRASGQEPFVQPSRTQSDNLKKRDAGRIAETRAINDNQIQRSNNTSTDSETHSNSSEKSSSTIVGEPNVESAVKINVLIRRDEPPFEIVEKDYKYEKSTAADHSPMQLNPKEYNQVTNNEGSNQKGFSGACKKSLPMFHGRASGQEPFAQPSRIQSDNLKKRDAGMIAERCGINYNQTQRGNNTRTAHSKSGKQPSNTSAVEPYAESAIKINVLIRRDEPPFEIVEKDYKYEKSTAADHSPMQLNPKEYNQVTNNEGSNQKGFSGACKKSLPMFHGRASGQEPFAQPSRIQSDNLKKRDAGMIAERCGINYNQTQRGNNTRTAHSKSGKQPSNTSAVEPYAESAIKVTLSPGSYKKPMKPLPAGNDSSNLEKDANEVKHWHWKATTVCHHEPHEKEKIIFDPPNKALKEEDVSFDLGNLTLNDTKLDPDIATFAADENFVDDYYESIVRDSNEDNEVNVLIRRDELPFEIVKTDYKYEKSTAADHSPVQLNPKEYNQVPLSSWSYKKPMKPLPAGNVSSNLEKDANEMKHCLWKATTVCHHEPHEKEKIYFDPPNKALKEEDVSFDLGNLTLNDSKLDPDIATFAADENFADDYYESIVRDSNEDNEIKVLLPDVILVKDSLSVDEIASHNITEEWIKLPLREIVKVEIGDEDQNGIWSDIFLQIVEHQQMQKFRKLLQLTNEHISALSGTVLPPFPASWFKPMQNCIVHYRNRYLRAKLHGIFDFGKKSSSVYRFFLCDCARFVLAKEEELYDNFLYPTSKNIIEFMPYQAVHCTLTGIDLDRYAKRYRVNKDYLFAYAVLRQENVSLNSLKFSINSFDIVLFENENPNDLSTMQMVNRTLVENVAATYNCNTKHYLDLDIAFAKTKTQNTTPKDSCTLAKVSYSRPAEKAPGGVTRNQRFIRNAEQHTTTRRYK